MKLSQWRVGRDSLAYAIAILGVFLFSLKPIFIKQAYQYNIDTPTLMALRMGFSLPIYLFVGYWLFRREEQIPPKVKKFMPKSMLVGLFGYYGASYFDLKALEIISAQFERLVLYAYPTLVVILGYVFFKYPIKKGTGTALILTYTGILVLFVHELEFLGAKQLFGAGLVFVSATFFALYILFSKQLVTEIGSMPFTVVAMCSASVAILVHFLVTNDIGDLYQPVDVYVLAIYIAIISTVLPTFLISEAIHRLGANTTSIIGSSGTLFTAILAVLILSEPFTAYHALALILVVSGIFRISNSK
jgi:drug/metabolite transporter (DMT)-like permease